MGHTRLCLLPIQIRTNKTPELLKMQNEILTYKNISSNPRKQRITYICLLVALAPIVHKRSSARSKFFVTVSVTFDGTNIVHGRVSVVFNLGQLKI